MAKGPPKAPQRKDYGGGTGKKAKGPKDVAGLPQVGVLRPEKTRPGRKPLGTSPEYRKRVETAYGPVAAAPRYYTGDEYLPGGRELPDRLALAQELVRVGLLDDKFATGAWNTQTRGAYKSLLQQANMAGMTWRDLLDQKIAEVDQLGVDRLPGSEGAGTKRAPNVVELTDPASIRPVIQSAAQELYGADLPEDQVAQITDSFRNIERQRQTQEYELGGPDSAGGEVDKIPSLDDYARERIKAANPNQVAATQFGNHLNDVISTFTRNPLQGYTTGGTLSTQAGRRGA